ncbi:hypothetical protein N9R79_03545 [Vibrio sp.]|nr:hypothetical protein [Vibrio sp.]
MYKPSLSNLNVTQNDFQYALEFKERKKHAADSISMGKYAFLVERCDQIASSMDRSLQQMLSHQFSVGGKEKLSKYFDALSSIYTWSESIIWSLESAYPRVLVYFLLKKITQRERMGKASSLIHAMPGHLPLSHEAVVAIEGNAFFDSRSNCYPLFFNTLHLLSTLNTDEQRWFISHFESDLIKNECVLAFQTVVSKQSHYSYWLAELLMKNGLLKAEPLRFWLQHRTLDESHLRTWLALYGDKPSIEWVRQYSTTSGYDSSDAIFYYLLVSDNPTAWCYQQEEKSKINDDVSYFSYLLYGQQTTAPKPCKDPLQLWLYPSVDSIEWLLNHLFEWEYAEARPWVKALHIIYGHLFPVSDKDMIEASWDDILDQIEVWFDSNQWRFTYPLRLGKPLSLASSCELLLASSLPPTDQEWVWRQICLVGHCYFPWHSQMQTSKVKRYCASISSNHHIENTFNVAVAARHAS